MSRLLRPSWLVIFLFALGCLASFAQAQRSIQPGPDRKSGEGEGPFERLVIRGATMIDGTGAPPIGPVDIVIENNRVKEIKYPPMSEGLTSYHQHLGVICESGAAKYQKGARRFAFFTNLLTADSTNLLSRGPTGAFLPLAFDTKTFDFEAGDSRAIGTHNALTFGGNFRHNGFDVSLAPNGDDRNEGGAFIQDEVFFGQHVLWPEGWAGRFDAVAAALALAAAIALFRFQRGVIEVIGACAAVGLGVHLLGLS